jgi:hypothetical protein
MEYRVIRKSTGDIDAGLNSMENLVSQSLAEGWQVAGGLCVTTQGNWYILTQAVQRVHPLPGNNETNFLNNINRMRG